MSIKLNNTVKNRKKEIIRNNTDDAWKIILNKYLKQFLELFWPDAYHDIDWNKPYEFLEQEMMKIQSSEKKGQRIIDKLIKVSLKNGIEKWILIHIEIQGDKEKDFEKRVYIYNYRISDRHQQFVASMAIIIDSNKKWWPNVYKEEMWGCSVEMKFPIIKVIDFISQEEMLKNSNNPFAIVMLAQLKAIESKGDEIKKLSNKKEIARMLYEKGFNREEIINIALFLDGIFAMSEINVIQYKEYIKNTEKELRVSYLSVFEQAGLERGRKEGFEIGIEKGIEKGEKTILIRLLNLKFQSFPNHYSNKIDLANSDELLKWAERILYCKTLEQVFED